MVREVLSVCETKICVQRHFKHHFLLKVYEELDAATAARRGLGTVPSRNPFLKNTKHTSVNITPQDVTDSSNDNLQAYTMTAWVSNLSIKCLLTVVSKPKTDPKRCPSKSTAQAYLRTKSIITGQSFVQTFISGHHW